MKQKDQKKPNLRDVARTANVSAATVSRVLTGAATVSADKKQRVEDAIEMLQFVPSSAARAINSGRTRLIGALIPTLDHAIFARFIEKVEETLNTRGLSLIVANTRFDAAQELDKARRLLDLGVEGLLVSGTSRAAEFDALVRRYDVPVVATSCFRADYTYPTVGYDNAAVARSALHHLTDLGHREIAVVSGYSANNDRTRERLSGLRSTVDIRLHAVETALSYAGARSAVRDLLHAPREFSAILCLSDVLAQGALLELRHSSDPRAPGMSVIGIDDLPSSEHFDPPLTTVHLPVGKMGFAAATAVADWVELGTQPDHVRLDTHLMTRATTRARE
ncbi:MAG: substrate-binding domain-containing protein [Pseudomonadota bacterium]